MAVFKGSKVSMADGSTKNVEDIVVGDKVIDYMNTVQAVDGIRYRVRDPNVHYMSHLTPERVALIPDIEDEEFPPWLRVVLINNELLITQSHLLFSDDGYIYDVFENNRLNQNDRTPIYLKYTNENNVVVNKMLWGLGENSEMLRELKVGVSLKTINGSKIVESIEEVDNSTLFYSHLFGHSVTNSGTYFVNGYCVEARINENWDYKNKKLYETEFSIIKNTDYDTQHLDDPKQIHRVFNLDKTTNNYPVWDSEFGVWK